MSSITCCTLDLQNVFVLPSWDFVPSSHIFIFHFLDYSVCVVFLKKRYFLILYLYGCLYVCLCTVFCTVPGVCRDQKRLLEPLWAMLWLWELNLCPLEEQKMLLNSVISPALPVSISVIGCFTYNKPSQFIPAVGADRILFTKKATYYCDVYTAFSLFISPWMVCYTSWLF